MKPPVTFAPSIGVSKRGLCNEKVEDDELFCCILGTSPPGDSETKYQHYLTWSSGILEKMQPKIESLGSYLAVHMRQGSDMHKSCAGITQNPNLLSFSQCVKLGISSTFENCYPSLESIQDNIEAVLEEFETVEQVYLASDSYADAFQLSLNLKAKLTQVTVVVEQQVAASDDLLILDQATVFLASCVSSFSAFVSRSRSLRDAPVRFIHTSNTKSQNHSEL